MDKVERTGVGVAVAGHVLLFGLLSLAVDAPDPPKPVPPPPMEVAFVEGVAMTPAAPEPVADAMPAAEAPRIGPVEEAMPNPAPVAESLPPPPRIELAPPPPKPTPPKPAPVADKPPPPKLKPVAKPKPVAAKPIAPKPKPAAVKPEPKPTVAKQVPAKAKPAPSASATKTAARQKTSATGAPASAKGKTAAAAPRLGKNFLAGLSDPSPGTADKPAAAAPVISANAMAAIQAAIKKQIQPCADRQVDPGPGANRISVKVNLKLNPDGSLAARPRVVSASGVNDENSRYEKRVGDLAIAAFTGCAPMRGLPADLYRTAKGGWHNFNMNYKLPG